MLLEYGFFIGAAIYVSDHVHCTSSNACMAKFSFFFFSFCYKSSCLPTINLREILSSFKYLVYLMQMNIKIPWAMQLKLELNFQLYEEPSYSQVLVYLE